MTKLTNDQQSASTISNGVMLNAYPDSIGTNLSDISNHVENA